jgi:GDP-L-fucose synthase
VHLAAVVGGIGANQAEPGRFFYENAVMGIELIDSCRVHGVAKTVVAGTVCAYPKLAPVPFREDDLWNGYPEETNAPYALAKKMLLVQAQAYRRQYGTNVVYVMPANLYGPGDDFDLDTGHVIPSMIRKLVEARARGDERVVLWGDGTPTREFVHVRDAARAFRLTLERYDRPEPLNIGSGEEISIRDLAAALREATRYQGELVWDSSRPNGQPRRRLSTDRARAFLDHVPSVALVDGLAETVRWYEATVGASVAVEELGA